VFGLTVISGNNLVLLAEPTTPNVFGENGSVGLGSQAIELTAAQSETDRIDENADDHTADRLQTVWRRTEKKN
jgi:hypothetical protein